MNEQLSASLAWIDRLHEVGDPIRKRRAEVLSLLDQAQRLDRHALALRGRAIGAHFALLNTVLQHWSEDEIARARGARPEAQPAPVGSPGRPIGELAIQLGGQSRRVSLADPGAPQSPGAKHWQALAELVDAAPDIKALSDRHAQMRVALELGLQAFDTSEARKAALSPITAEALRAMYEALDMHWPVDAG